MIDYDDDILTLANKRNMATTRCEVNMNRKWYVASCTIVLSRLGIGTLLTLDRTAR